MQQLASVIQFSSSPYRSDPFHGYVAHGPLLPFHRLQVGGLSAGIAPSRRAAASMCDWALQPVGATICFRLSRVGVRSDEVSDAHSIAKDPHRERHSVTAMLLHT